VSKGLQRFGPDEIVKFFSRKTFSHRTVGNQWNLEIDRDYTRLPKPHKKLRSERITSHAWDSRALRQKQATSSKVIEAAK
jgi:hypothetical protein